MRGGQAGGIEVVVVPVVVVAAGTEAVADSVGVATAASFVRVVDSELAGLVATVFECEVNYYRTAQRVRMPGMVGWWPNKLGTGSSAGIETEV